MKRPELWGRVDRLAAYLDELEEILPASKEGYRTSLIARLAVERSIERIVECARDLNSALYLEAGHRMPHTYFDSFTELPKIKVVSKADANKLASLAGLRNRIVHDYEELDHGVVYDAVKRVPTLITRYLSGVRNWMRRHNL
jgi:uncharacterized protein YutE (UPF0331/DUF86 family)